MSNKYDKVLIDLLNRFSTDSDVDESTRKIIREVINAEINKIDLKKPHKIIEEIKEIIDREAKKCLTEP